MRESNRRTDPGKVSQRQRNTRSVWSEGEAGVGQVQGVGGKSLQSDGKTSVCSLVGSVYAM